MNLEVGKTYMVVSGYLSPRVGNGIDTGDFFKVKSKSNSGYFKAKTGSAFANTTIFHEDKLSHFSVQEVTERDWRSSIKEMTFRLMVQREVDGRVESIKHTQTELQKASTSRIITYHFGEGSVLLAQNRFTGVLDDDCTPIFEGDVIECTEHTTTYKAVVRFGEYDQDGSSGEYEPIACIGFYADAMTLSDYATPPITLYGYATSLLCFNKIKIIGNVWQNPELIEGEAE